MEWLNESGHENVGKTVKRIQLPLQEVIGAVQVKKNFWAEAQKT